MKVFNAARLIIDGVPATPEQLHAECLVYKDYTPLAVARAHNRVTFDSRLEAFVLKDRQPEDSRPAPDYFGRSQVRGSLNFDRYTCRVQLIESHLRHSYVELTLSSSNLGYVVFADGSILHIFAEHELGYWRGPNRKRADAVRLAVAAQRVGRVQAVRENLLGDALGTLRDAWNGYDFDLSEEQLFSAAKRVAVLS